MPQTQNSVRLQKLGSSFLEDTDVSPERRAKELAEQAVELLDALKASGSLDAIQNAKALQFVFYGKGGVLISRAKGQGFSLVRTAAGGWSPPLLLELDSWNLGVTLGWKAAAHVALALSDEASKLLGQQGVLRSKGAGAKLTVGTLQAGTEHGTHDVVALGTNSGLLLDVSAPVPLLSGDLKVDPYSNQELYGEGGSLSATRVDWPGRVLRCEGGPALAPPVQFSPLYERLAELAK